MAITVSSNLYQPQLDGPLTVKRVIEKFAAIRSSAFQINPLMTGLIASDSSLITVPNWIPLTGASERFNESGTPVTVNNIAQETSVGVRGFRKAAHGATALAALNGMGDPSEAIRNALGEFWTIDYNRTVGKYLSSIDSLLLFDITGETEKVLTPAVIFDAANTKGENFLLLNQLHVHNDVYTYLKKADLIDYVKPSEAGEIAVYAGKQLVVDSTLPKVETSSGSGVYNYTSRLMGTGAVQYGLTSVPKWAGVDVDLKTSEEIIISNIAFALHVPGTTLTSTGITLAQNVAQKSGFTDAQYATAANFGLQWDAAYIPYVAIKHRLAS